MFEPTKRFFAQHTALSILSRWSCLLAIFMLLPGCSIKRMAVNKLGDALSGGGSTFASDDDPELVKAAVPFSLKLMETLLAQSPNHKGLLLATSSGFTQYAFAFVQQDADEMEDDNFEAATAMRQRARRLYLRALDYGLRALEVSHPGFRKALAQEPSSAVRKTARQDVPLLYWTAAAWGSAISLSKDDSDMIADSRIVEALIDRACELDESFGQGAIHSFLINYEMSRPEGTGKPADRARQHFERAVALSGGHQAGPYVSLAEAVCQPQQDLPGFKALLEQALAVKVDAVPEQRLANTIMQRRAKWLLGRTEELFMNTGKESPEKTVTP